MITICVYFDDNNKCVDKTQHLKLVSNIKDASLVVLKPMDEERIDIQVFDSKEQCLAYATLPSPQWYKKFNSAKNNVDTLKGICNVFFSEQANKIFFTLVKSNEAKIVASGGKENKDHSNVINDFLRHTKSYDVPWHSISRTDSGAKTPVLEESMDDLDDPPQFTRQLTST